MRVKEFFQRYGGWSVWLFIIGLPPQVWQNFSRHAYTSGPLASWTLFATAYFLFGTYAWCKKDWPVVIGQFTGGVLCVVILLQGLLY